MAAAGLTQGNDVERITSDDLTSEHVGQYVGVFGAVAGARRTFAAGILVGFTHRTDEKYAIVTDLHIVFSQKVDPLVLRAVRSPIAVSQTLRPVLEASLVDD